MKINILAVGTKMSNWIDAGCNEYLKRFPKSWELQIKEIVQKQHHSKHSVENIKIMESDVIMQNVKHGTYLVALDENGAEMNSMTLSKKIELWQIEGRNLTVIIGGPNGLSNDLLQKCDFIWSLSQLTFPHPLARLILLEQLYRAWTITNKHPYHRP